MKKGFFVKKKGNGGSIEPKPQELIVPMPNALDNIWKSEMIENAKQPIQIPPINTTQNVVTPAEIKDENGIIDYTGQSFADAFSKARDLSGNSTGTFKWNGNTYGTEYATEAKNAGRQYWIDPDTGENIVESKSSIPITTSKTYPWIPKSFENKSRFSNTLPGDDMQLEDTSDWDRIVTENKKIKTEVDTIPIPKKDSIISPDTFKTEKKTPPTIIKDDTGEFKMEIADSLGNPPKIEITPEVIDTVNNFIDSKGEDYKYTQEDLDELSTLINIPKAYLAYYAATRGSSLIARDIPKLIRNAFVSKLGTKPLPTPEMQFPSKVSKGETKLLKGNAWKVFRRGILESNDPVKPISKYNINLNKYFPGYNTYNIGKKTINASVKTAFKAGDVIEAGTQAVQKGSTKTIQSISEFTSSILKNASKIKASNIIGVESKVGKYVSPTLKGGWKVLGEVASKIAWPLTAVEILTMEGNNLSWAKQQPSKILAAGRDAEREGKSYTQGMIEYYKQVKPGLLQRGETDIINQIESNIASHFSQYSQVKRTNLGVPKEKSSISNTGKLISWADTYVPETKKVNTIKSSTKTNDNNLNYQWKNQVVQ